MNKQQQIEEIEKDIHRVCTSCSREMFDEYTCDRCQAKLLIKKGYRKLPEDSVVLSREEYEKLKYTWITDSDAYKKGCKETAEKILFKFESAFAYYDNEDMFSKKAIFECLEEIVKSCGVEIKE